MNLDKNKTRRQDLENDIKKVESKEDDIVQLRNQFERTLEDFQMKFRHLSRQNNDLLENTANSGSKRAVNELEESQMFTLKVDRYVNTQLKELSNTDKTIRKSLNDEREKLLKERNNLPWE